MTSAEAVLATEDGSCECGCTSTETVDGAVVCCGCGKMLEREVLVSYAIALSSGIAAGDNFVPEGCTGVHLSGAKSSINYKRRDKIKRLHTLAAYHGRHLEMSQTAIATALNLIEDHTRGQAVSDISAVAAALLQAARTENHPVTMKEICLRLEVPFMDCKRSLASLRRQMTQPAVPTLQVDELLKCSLSRFCAARSIPNNVGKQLLALAKSLLQLTRRHMKPSVVLSDAAACAMLALELVVEISPTAAVVDDLCVGHDVQGLKTAYFWPLYRAVHDLCVKHGVVSGAVTHGGACNDSSESGRSQGMKVIRGKRKRSQQTQQCSFTSGSRSSTVTEYPKLTLQQVRSMLDVDEIMTA